MADQKRIAGVQSFTVSQSGAPAVRFLVGGTANYRLSGTDRESLVGATGYAGFKAMPVVGFIECEVYIQQDFDLSQTRDWSDVTATLVTAANKVVQCTGHLVTTPEPSAVDGVFTLRFEGLTEEVSIG